MLNIKCVGFACKNMEVIRIQGRVRTSWELSKNASVKIDPRTICKKKIIAVNIKTVKAPLFLNTLFIRC